MDDQVEYADASLDLDEVSLSDRHFDTDPTSIAIESADPHKLRFQLIQWLAESPNRKVKAERKKQIADTLGKSTRQVERLLNQYNQDRLPEASGVKRSDKGQHRVDPYWQNYIRDVYEKSVKNKHPLKPADVVREVKRHAVIDLHHEEGDCPHPATIYRILKPLIERQKRRKKIRNPGSGSWLAVETRNGQLLKAEFSNQIVQCDHTKLDIFIVDANGQILARPWLTTVIDTWSSCLLGYHLWFKQPGSEEVALTLRHAILPKEYPPEYQLEKPWNVYGPPFQYFFTDGGKDFRSKHLKAIGKQLGFQCELRDRPPQGGIVERLFKTINTQVLETLPGHTGRNVQERREQAEKEACLTIEDLDRIFASYFCDDYNHQPYPKDPHETRYERWLKGMGFKLPEPLSDRDLDVCLMKGEQRVVQAHGSIYFETLTYRCEELRSLKGEYVSLRYDPDHILTIYVYHLDTGDRAGEFIGYAHAINLDTQELSLDELKRQNKQRSQARGDRSNYDALLALDKRQELIEQRQQEKKQRQRAAQKKLRQKDKQDSKIVALRKSRAPKRSRTSPEPELLPERIDLEEVKPSKTKPLSQPAEPAGSDSQPSERHQLVIPKDRTLKRIW